MKRTTVDELRTARATADSMLEDAIAELRDFLRVERSPFAHECALAHCDDYLKSAARVASLERQAMREAVRNAGVNRG